MTGTGTVSDPYIISTLADLQAMESDLTAYYELGGDIDASGSTAYDGGAGFVPIGQGDYFIGQLDGKDYTISDLFINRAGNYQALFYNIDTGCVIKNVKMTDVSITITSGYAHGALVGYMRDGTVTNCSSTGLISGSGTSDMAGGLIGQEIAGAISKCWSSCTVTVGDDYAGGFIGYAQGGTIDDCYARGNATAGDDYAGGFCGFNQGATIDDCYSTGIATATGGFGEGGFLGDDSGGSETNCFWDTETSGNATDGGSATGKTTAQMKAQATFTNAGWDFTTIWFIDGTTNNGYPAFSGGTLIYPTDPTIRVTSIIHRYDRGVYNTELLFGDIISDFSVPNVDSTTTKTYQSKEELEKIYKSSSREISDSAPIQPPSPSMSLSEALVKSPITQAFLENPFAEATRKTLEMITPWDEGQGESFSTWWKRTFGGG